MVKYSEEKTSGGLFGNNAKIAKKPQYLKCAVCSLIYGEFIGDAPPGSMTWEYQIKGQCP